MRLRKSLFATSILFVLMIVSCTSTPPKKENENDGADSIKVAALTLQLDSVQADLTTVSKQYEDLKLQMSALRDSFAKIESKNSPNNRIKYGGEPKGDPIRDGDGIKKGGK